MNLPPKYSKLSRTLQIPEPSEINENPNNFANQIPSCSAVDLIDSQILEGFVYRDIQNIKNVEMN